MIIEHHFVNSKLFNTQKKNLQNYLALILQHLFFCVYGVVEKVARAAM